MNSADGRVAKGFLGFGRGKMVDYSRKKPHLLNLLRYSPLNVLKAAETKLLRKRASTYCYNYPAFIQVEVTTRCNLTCYMCPRMEELKKKGTKARDMSFETFKTIVDQAQGLYSINPFGRGEPLIVPDIFRMIEYSVEKRVPHVSITTNGLLLKGETARALSRTGLTELRISIDGADEETYWKIRRADLAELKACIKEFRRISDIPISINFVLGEENWDGLRQMPSLTAEVGAQCLRVFHMLGEHASKGKRLALDDGQGERYGSMSKELRGKCKDLGVAFIMDRLEYRSCLWPFIMAFIDIDGYLTPCCKLEEIQLDSVLEKGLFPAWNGLPMRRWRSHLLLGRIPKRCLDIHCIAGSP
jgi:MoaA/NifB/PqqE/SkfB family radical SAM enzyme